MRAVTALSQALREAPQNGTVLDVGCLGFKPVAMAARERPDLRHAGCDLATPDDVPAGYDFRLCDLETQPIPFDDDAFDLVICAHVIEHLRDPLALAGELLRVCRPGGAVYLEAPSDRSLWLSYPGAQERYLMLSFWDDPTHVGRPWTPQALLRLAVYYDAELISVGYDTTWADKLAMVPRLIVAWLSGDSERFVRAWWAGLGWSCYSVTRKPAGMRGKPEFVYFSFEGRRARSVLPRGKATS